MRSQALPIVLTRPWRHAQTWGLTLLNGLEAFGLEAPGEAQVELLIVDAHKNMRAGGRGAEAADEIGAEVSRGVGCGGVLPPRPITESSSVVAPGLAAGGDHLGPATPKNCALGTCARMAVISAAPRRSPESSPATMPTRSGSSALAEAEWDSGCTDVAREGSQWRGRWLRGCEGSGGPYRGPPRPAWPRKSSDDATRR